MQSIILYHMHTPPAQFVRSNSKATVYVSNIQHNMTEQDLEELFKQVGAPIIHKCYCCFVVVCFVVVCFVVVCFVVVCFVVVCFTSRACNRLVLRLLTVFE